LAHIGDKKEGVGGGGEVFAEAGLEGGPEMLDGVEVWGIGRQEQQVTASGFDQLKRRRGLMKAGVVQHDHAAWRQRGQQHLGKINIHDLRVATALKRQRRDQLAVPESANDAGAVPAFARHGFVNPFAPWRTAKLTIQAVIHAALVKVKDGLAAELFEFALEPPPLHLAAFAVFDEFFLA